MIKMGERIYSFSPSSLIFQSCVGHLITGLYSQSFCGVHPPNYALGL